MQISWKLCGKIAATVIGIYLFIQCFPAVASGIGIVAQATVPLLAGCVIAYVVNILMTFYEKYFELICRHAAIRRYERPFCMFLSFLTLVLVGVVLWQLIIPQLVACFTIVCGRFPEVLNLVYEWLEARFRIGQVLADQIQTWQDGVFRWESFLQKVPEAMKSLKGILQKLGSVLLTFLLGLVFAIYILARKERLARDFHSLAERLISPQLRKRIGYVLAALDRAFHSFIVGQCVEAVILGVLCVIGMWIFRFPYALMIGCLVGVTALIPVAGAYIGAGVGAFMILTVSPVKALLFLVFIAVLQQIEGNFIYPRVVGNTIGLPGIWVLAAVVVGGGAFGIPGMLIGVPLAAAIYQLLCKNDT